MYMYIIGAVGAALVIIIVLAVSIEMYRRKWKKRELKALRGSLGVGDTPLMTARGSVNK